MYNGMYSSDAWWRHQMETFSALLALCAGIQRSPVNSPHKDKWRGALMFSLIWAWINGWVNNGEAGDLRRHRAHYDVILMDSGWPVFNNSDNGYQPSVNEGMFFNKNLRDVSICFRGRIILDHVKTSCNSFRKTQNPLPRHSFPKSRDHR